MARNRGIVRKVDSLGRVVLPAEYRRMYDMAIEEPVEMVGTEDGILIRKPQIDCIFCKGTEKVHEHYGQLVCDECLANLKKIGAGR